MLILKSTLVRFGPGLTESGLEKVQQWGFLEVEFGQELLDEDLGGSYRDASGIRQSIVIIGDVIVRAKCLKMAGMASIDFTSVNSGDVIRE